MIGLWWGCKEAAKRKFAQQEEFDPFHFVVNASATFRIMVNTRCKTKPKGPVGAGLQRGCLWNV